MNQRNPQLKQCIYIDQELERLIPLGEYLETTFPIHPASLAYSGLSLQVNQVELLGSEYEFGQLNIMKFQWEELLARLQSHKVGLVCNGRHDAHAGPKLIFEPGQEYTSISMAYFDDQFDLHLPIDGLLGSQVAQDLYSYLEFNLDEVVHTGNQFYQPHFTRIKYPTDQLHHQIQLITTQIGQLYQKLKKELTLEFYFDS